MSRKVNVFAKEHFFVILDHVTSGRVTGEKKDTITIFFRGGGSSYFYVGAGAEEILEELVAQLRDTTQYNNFDEEFCTSEGSYQ